MQDIEWLKADPHVPLSMQDLIMIELAMVHCIPQCSAVLL